MANLISTVDFLNSYISPTTGRILCTTDYMLVGNAQGIATPGVGPIGILPDLTENKMWVGDASNRPIEKNYVGDTTYLLRLSDPVLPSAQNLISLGLGLIKTIPTPTGIVALAIPSVDYALPSFAAALIAIAIPLAVDALRDSDAAALSEQAAFFARNGAIAEAAEAENSRLLAEADQAFLENLEWDDLSVLGDIDMENYRIINVDSNPVNLDGVNMSYLWTFMNS